MLAGLMAVAVLTGPVMAPAIQRPRQPGQLVGPVYRRAAALRRAAEGADAPTAAAAPTAGGRSRAAQERDRLHQAARLLRHQCGRPPARRRDQQPAAGRY